MATITTQHALKIVKKLKATVEKGGKANDIAHVFHRGRYRFVRYTPQFQQELAASAYPRRPAPSPTRRDPVSQLSARTRNGCGD